MAKKTRNECIDAARVAMNLFTGDELHAYINRVSEKSKELHTQGVPFARDRAIKEINQEQLQLLLDDSASAARNIEKYDEIGFKMDKEVTPKSFMNKEAKNTDYNVETASNAVKQMLHDKSFGTMTKETLSTLEDAKIDDSVYEVADGGQHSDPVITNIGKSLSDYILERNARLIESDAMAASNIHKDRYFKNTYDQSKLLKIGRENWIPLHKSRINVEETFKYTRAANSEGVIDHEIVDEMIGNTFDNIIEGNGPLFTRSSVSRDSEMIQRSRHMFYIYKDWKHWGMANTEYGQGTLFEAWLKDINTSSQQAGMAEIFGTNPEQMYLEMKHIQAKKKNNTMWNSIKASEADALFNNLLGASRGAFNANMANIGASIRSATSVARLGGIVLQSLSDPANVAAFAQRAGAGYWKPYLDNIVHLFNLIPSESRQELARVMSSVVNITSGTVTRFSDISGMGKTVNKLSNKFFHGLGLHAYDKGNKLGAMVPILELYGKQSSKDFNKLTRQQQSYLNRFNISPLEWDALRAKTEKRFFSTDNVKRLDDSELRTLWSAGNKNISLSSYRSNLYRKVFAMFDTAHEFSVLNPTAYTNMLTTSNLRPGHIGGEIWRMFSQFKAYPIQHFRRVWVGGMQDFDSWQGRMMYALNQSLGTIALAALSETLIAISKGYSPPDPSKMSKGELFKYSVKLVSGGAGVFNALLNDKSTSKTAIGAFLGTPSWKFMYDPLKTAFSLTTGDLKGAKQAAREFVNVANPIATVPIISPFVDAFLGNKPYLEPGQHRLF